MVVRVRLEEVIEADEVLVLTHLQGFDFSPLELHVLPVGLALLYDFNRVFFVGLLMFAQVDISH